MNVSDMLICTGFRYCPRCGKARPRSHEKNGMRCVHCGFIYFHNCASAVAAIIESEAGIVLAKRSRDPASGRYDLPGGFVEYGETLEQALTREVKEELGITIEHPHYFGSFPNEYRYEKVTYYTTDAFFVCRADLGALRPNEEIAGIAILNPRMIDFSMIAFEATSAALKKYQAGLGR